MMSMNHTDDAQAWLNHGKIFLVGFRNEKVEYKNPSLEGFFLSKLENSYTTESSRFGANQRFASSSVQPLRFA